MNQIIEIEVGRLRIHPKNVRTSYNDIDELADSIKAQGILQNLTVVPNPEEEGTYLVVIGNRRLTAALRAGIETVPCKIVEMSEKDQVSTMLLENMQRNDLTIYEQAQGFQMILDLGETEEGLAEKTGFSKTTIRRRLNIGRLDGDVLKKGESQNGHQFTLTDLYQLEKVEDIKKRNEILKQARSSSDIAWRVEQAVEERKKEKNLELYISAVQKLGVKKAPKEAKDQWYGNEWETVKRFELTETPPKKIRFEDCGEQLYYLERYGTLYIIHKAVKKEKILTPQEEETKRKEKNKKKLKDLMKQAAAERKVFIKGIIAGRYRTGQEEKEIEEELFDLILRGNSCIGNAKIDEFFMGKPYFNGTAEEKEEAAVERKSLTGILHKMFCVAAEQMGNMELMDWNHRYHKERGERMQDFYTILGGYGFSFSNNEILAAVYGTSELYEKEEV